MLNSVHISSISFTLIILFIFTTLNLEWLLSSKSTKKIISKLHHFPRYNFYPKSSFSIKCGFKYHIICFSVEIACFLSLSPYLIWIQSENQKWSLYCDHKKLKKKNILAG